MTGAVNVTMRTLYAPPATATLVLSIYMLAVTAIALLLNDDDFVTAVAGVVRRALQRPAATPVDAAGASIDACNPPVHRRGRKQKQT
jgi:hypothetical protein